MKCAFIVYIIVYILFSGIGMWHLLMPADYGWLTDEQKLFLIFICLIQNATGFVFVMMRLEKSGLY